MTNLVTSLRVPGTEGGKRRQASVSPVPVGAMLAPLRACFLSHVLYPDAASGVSEVVRTSLVRPEHRSCIFFLLPWEVVLWSAWAPRH